MSIEAMKRIKSLLQDGDKIDSHTISAVVAECDAVILTQQPATPEPVAWLRSSDLANLRTCNYMHIGADSPNIWAPNDVSTPNPEMGLVPVYAHPVPSVPADVVRDAGRYRYLRDIRRRDAIVLSGPEAGVWCDAEDEDGTLLLLTEDDLDAAIDAAMLAAK